MSGKRLLDSGTAVVSTRAALAAVTSLFFARELRLAEFYWAPISTIVILLSTMEPLQLAWQRFAGTALGAALGALSAAYFHPSLTVYGIGVFVCGIVSAIFRVGAAFRFTAITLTIVVLIPHAHAPWIVAIHRFIEVSLGIAVALVFGWLWRLPPELSTRNPPQQSANPSN